VPHGLSVIVSAPAVFRALAESAPERHLEAARALHAVTRGAAPDDAGAILSGARVSLMRATGAPSGIGAVGYTAADARELAAGTLAQRRLVDNAPVPLDERAVAALFEGALAYW
jgi:alcohol dehydrogenase class IV